MPDRLETFHCFTILLPHPGGVSLHTVGNAPQVAIRANTATFS